MVDLQDPQQEVPPVAEVDLQDPQQEVPPVAEVDLQDPQEGVAEAVVAHPVEVAHLVEDPQEETHLDPQDLLDHPWVEALLCLKCWS